VQDVIAARELAESAVVRRAPAAVAVFRMGQDEMEVPSSLTIEAE
jgi:hypothetical protein